MTNNDDEERTLTLMREIERLRTLITAWADEQVQHRLLTTAEANLRKAVGR